MVEAMEKQPLDVALLKGIPAKHLPSEQRGKLQRAMKAFDNMGRLKVDTGEVYIHEPSMRALLRNREFFPPELEHEFMRLATEGPGPKFFTQNERGMKPIRWLEVGDRVESVRPQLDVTYERLGLNESSTVEDIKYALRQRLGDLPDEAFEGDTLRTRIQSMMPGRTSEASEVEREALSSLSQVYYCVERRLGWWALVTLVGVILVALACIAPTPAAWFACFWLPAVAWVGITAFITIAACILYG